MGIGATPHLYLWLLYLLCLIFFEWKVGSCLRNGANSKEPTGSNASVISGAFLSCHAPHKCSPDYTPSVSIQDGRRAKKTDGNEDREMERDRACNGRLLSRVQQSE